MFRSAFRMLTAAWEAYKANRERYAQHEAQIRIAIHKAAHEERRKRDREAWDEERRRNRR